MRLFAPVITLFSTILYQDCAVGDVTDYSPLVSTACGNNLHVYPDHLCHRFLVCKNGMWVMESCPPDKVFDLQMQRCIVGTKCRRKRHMVDKAGASRTNTPKGPHHSNNRKPRLNKQTLSSSEPECGDHKSEGLSHTGAPLKKFRSCTTTVNGRTQTTLWYYNFYGQNYKFTMKGPKPAPRDQMIVWLENHHALYNLTEVPYMGDAQENQEPQRKRSYNGLQKPPRPTSSFSRTTPRSQSAINISWPTQSSAKKPPKGSTPSRPIKSTRLESANQSPPPYATIPAYPTPTPRPTSSFSRTTPRPQSAIAPSRPIQSAAQKSAKRSASSRPKKSARLESANQSYKPSPPQFATRTPRPTTSYSRTTPRSQSTIAPNTGRPIQSSVQKPKKNARLELANQSTTPYGPTTSRTAKIVRPGSATTRRPKKPPRPESAYGPNLSRPQNPGEYGPATRTQTEPPRQESPYGSTTSRPKNPRPELAFNPNFTFIPERAPHESVYGPIASRPNKPQESESGYGPSTRLQTEPPARDSPYNPNIPATITHFLPESENSHGAYGPVPPYPPIEPEEHIKPVLRPSESTRPSTQLKPAAPDSSSTTKKPGTAARVLPSECGLSGKTLASRVTGGVPANIVDNPWQVALLSSKTLKLACGGSIIASKIVLSATHCFQRPSSEKGEPDIFVDKRERVVLPGATSIADPKDVFQITSLFLHHLYQSDHKRNDIALLVVSKEFDFSSGKVFPICLPNPTTNYSPRKKCKVSGWGATHSDASRTEEILRATAVGITTNEECTKDNKKYNRISKGMMCAGDYLEGGPDTCTGDSGGPLSCIDHGRAYLYGITSFGIGCGEARHPGVYVRVGLYRPWIENRLAVFAEVRSRSWLNPEDDRDADFADSLEDVPDPPDPDRDFEESLEDK